MKARTFRAYGPDDIDRIPQLQALSPEKVIGIKAAASVFPFRVNDYVLEELIDWNNVPNDPMFQLTFPQEGMLERTDFLTMADLVRGKASRAELRTAADPIY